MYAQNILMLINLLGNVRLLVFRLTLLKFIAKYFYVITGLNKLVVINEPTWL